MLEYQLLLVSSATPLREESYSSSGADFAAFLWQTVKLFKTRNLCGLPFDQVCLFCTLFVQEFSGLIGRRFCHGCADNLKT
jgi:hypothetical protein